MSSYADKRIVVIDIEARSPRDAVTPKTTAVLNIDDEIRHAECVRTSPTACMICEFDK